MILPKAQIKTLTLSKLTLSKLFIWFTIYSFTGWLYETLYCSFTSGKYISRGFLFGPFCPIYGITIILMIVLVSDHSNKVIFMFFECAAISSMVEYISSYWLEVVFDRRWWDYSDKFLNLNGRVCLEAAILFGFCGILIIRIIHPRIIRLIDRYFTDKMIKSFVRVFLSILFFDFLLSCERSLNFMNFEVLK